MQVIMKKQTYEVTLVGTVTVKGLPRNQYQFKGPRATYFSIPYTNIPGKSFLVDLNCKISLYMRKYTVLEKGETAEVVK